MKTAFCIFTNPVLYIIELGLRIWNMIFFSYLLLFKGIEITKGKDYLFLTELSNVVREAV